MDIAFLSRMVKDLLQRHETLALPSFGNFYFEIADASFTDKGFAIAPPYRVLSFSAGKGQDNLLAECYADANGIDLAHAKRIISEFCAEIKDTLTKSKSLDFPGLGRMKETAGGAVIFIADENLELCPAYDMLEKVSLRYIPEGHVAAVAAEKPTATTATEQPTAETGAATTPATEQTAVETATATTPATEQTAAETGAATTPATEQPAVETTTATTPATEQPTAETGAATTPATEQLAAETTTAATPAAASTPVTALETTSLPQQRNAAIKWAVVITVLALLFIALLAATGRLCPDIIDRLLYNDAQLEMLNYLKD